LSLKTLVSAVGLISLSLCASSSAADLPVVPKITASALHESLERTAALLLIRAIFDVADRGEIRSALQHEAERLAQSGPDPQADALVNESLIAEGSYYITSLRYLIIAGAPNWPSDKTDSEYDAASLAILTDLQHQWLEVVENGGNLLPVLSSVDEINAQTEGASSATGSLDHFGQLEELVDEAVAAVPGLTPG
jgi:hypothetical protein